MNRAMLTKIRELYDGIQRALDFARRNFQTNRFTDVLCTVYGACA